VINKVQIKLTKLNILYQDYFFIIPKTKYVNNYYIEPIIYSNIK